MEFEPSGIHTPSQLFELRADTQLNEPPTKVSGLQGEKGESLFVSLKIQSSFLLKFSTLLQSKNVAGRLFHASTILTEKKYFHNLNEPVEFIYFKFMTSQLCIRHGKEITVLYIIETFKILKA